MTLRLDEVYTHERVRRGAGACSLVLACAVLLAVAASTAVAAPGDPREGAPPQELWEAFPLNPRGERLRSDQQRAGQSGPFTPPGRPQVAAEISSEAASSDLPLLTLAGGAGTLILLALLGFATVRLRNVAGHRRHSAPLWQGTAGIEASPVARLQQYADVEVALKRPSRLIAGEVERRPGTRPRPRLPQASRDLRVIAHRMRRAIWNENTAPFIVGAGIAIVVAFLIIYLVG